MSNRSLTILAFTLAVILTALGWQQVMIYKTPPLPRLALWFPLVVLLRVHDIAAVLVSFIQFPLFATAFGIAVRLWSAGRAFIALVLIYVLCAGGAFVLLRS